MAVNRSSAHSALPLFGLCNLAIAQPLFDLLGRQPEFLVTRHADGLQIVLLSAAVAFAMPALLILAVEGAGLLLVRVTGRQEPRKLLRSAALAPPAAALFLISLRRLPGLPGEVGVVLAALLGLAAAFLYHQREAVRLFARVLAPLSLAVPVVFLFMTPVRRLLFPEPAPSRSPESRLPEDGKSVPVVLAVFDELPTSSLLDAEGRVDASLYPSFAEVASTSLWFRNATAVATLTLQSIPAILTGQYARPGLLPTRQDHPRNLCATLEASHHLRTLEPMTELCPGSGIGARRQPFADLLRDAALVYLHVLLPPPFNERLKSIATNWTWDEEIDKARDFRLFTEGIRSTRRPPFLFVHSPLPHHPWTYLPSGKRYIAFDELILDGVVPGRGSASARWVDDEWPVAQAYQRHLLQLRFTDRLLGELVARLREVDLWDPSLVVVTADHGVSFLPGQYMRRIDRANYVDVMSVPLFVKLPGQRQAEIREDSAELIDVVPTIRDALGLSADPALPGRSLLGDSLPRPEKVVYHTRDLVFTIRDPTQPGKYRTAAYRRSRFPPELGAAGLFALAPAGRSLLGRSAADFRSLASTGPAARIDALRSFEHVDLDSPILPCRVSGRLLDRAEPPDPVNLALAVNGTIAALSRTRTDPGYRDRFSFTIAEGSLRPGRNDLALFLVRGTEPDVLTPVAIEPVETFAIAAGGSGEIVGLRSSRGEVLALDPARFEGEVADVVFEHNPLRVEFVGWACDRETGEVPDAIVVFAGGRWIHTGRLNFDEARVRAFYNLPGREKCGFVHVLPRRETSGEILFFAISRRGYATRLRYEKVMKPQPLPE